MMDSDCPSMLVLMVTSVQVHGLPISIGPPTQSHFD